MAKFNEWLDLRDLGRIQDMPDWMRRSLNGDYFNKRLDATLAGELSQQELAAMKKIHSQQNNVSKIAAQIEKELHGMGYDVKFNLTKEGVLSMAFRPQKVLGEWSRDNSSLYQIGLDMGAGFAAGAKGGIKRNTLMIDAEGKLISSQESQLLEILSILKKPKTKDLFSFFSNPDKWLKSRMGRLEIQKKFYPAKKQQELAVLGASKTKQNKIAADLNNLLQINPYQLARTQMQSRELNLAPFYKKQAENFAKGIHISNTYEESIGMLSDLIKDVATNVLTFRGEDKDALKLMELNKNSKILKQNEAAWNQFSKTLLNIRKAIPMTWSGEAGNVYSGANIAIGKHNAILPGMELSELGSKNERAASNLLLSTTTQRVSHTRPLRIISEAAHNYQKIMEEELGYKGKFKKQQGMRVALLNEGVDFDPEKVLMHMANILKNDVARAKKFFGTSGKKGYAGYEEFLKKNPKGTAEDWLKKEYGHIDQYSLAFEQVLVGKNALKALNAQKINPEKIIEKSLLDSRAAIIAKQIAEKRGVTEGKVQTEALYAAAKELFDQAGISKIKITEGEVGSENEGKYIVSSVEKRRGQSGTKIMFGSGLHGTIVTPEDAIIAAFLSSLGFKDTDIFDSRGNYRIGAIATSKANARTLGGASNAIFNKLTSIMHRVATNSDKFKIDGDANISSRANSLTGMFAKNIASSLNKINSNIDSNLVEEIFGNFLTTNNATKPDSLTFISKNIHTVIDEAMSKGQLPSGHKDQIISAVLAGAINTIEDLYKLNPQDVEGHFGKNPWTLENVLDENGKVVGYNIGQSNKHGSIVEMLFGQPEIALYGDPRSKGGRAVSFGHKNTLNLKRSAIMANQAGLKTNIEAIDDFYNRQLFEGGLSIQNLGTLQNDVRHLITLSQLTTEQIEKYPDHYKVISMDEIYNNDWYDTLDQLSKNQKVVQGDLKNGVRGYSAEDFEKSPLFQIYKAQQEGKTVLLPYEWAALEEDRYGRRTGAQGSYVPMAALAFKKTEDGKYYIPDDTAQGAMALINLAEIVSLIRGKGIDDIQHNFGDPTDQMWSEITSLRRPTDYMKRLHDYVFEKNSALVEKGTKAQLRHGAGPTAIAAPTHGDLAEFLRGGSRGVMSPELMRAILKRANGEDEGQHLSALKRYADELGIQVSDNDSANDIVNNIINKIDIDNPNNRTNKGKIKNTLKGLFGFGYRYPLLTDYNMPGVEFFVSSKLDKTDKDHSTLMLNQELMELLNADVDGDRLYALLSLADAEAGGLTEEQYKDVLQAQKSLTDFGNKIVKNMQQYKKAHNIVNETQENADFIKWGNIKSLNNDINTNVISNLAGEAVKKNFADVGKYDNLRQVIQEFEQQRGGGVWGLNGSELSSTNIQDLFNSLVMSEFATIFPQEGISAKKVFEKLSARKDFDWRGHKTDAEKIEFIENVFRATYEKLLDPNTYTKKGMQTLGEELAAWGLIDNQKGKTAASDKRASTLFSLMAVLDPDNANEWLGKTLDWKTITQEVLKYNKKIKNIIPLENGKSINLSKGGIADLFKFNRSNLLPYSHVATLKDIIGSGKLEEKTREEQDELLKKFSPQTRKILGTRYALSGSTANTAAGLMGLAAGGIVPEEMLIRYKQYSGGYKVGDTVGDDLVAKAVAQQDIKGIKTTSVSKTLEFLDRNSYQNISSDDTFGIYKRLRKLTPEGIKNLNYDQISSLLAQYRTIEDVLRGNFMNFAQVIAQYGTKEGRPVSFEDIEKAAETGNWDSLGLSKNKLKKLQKAWGIKDTESVSKMRARAEKLLGYQKGTMSSYSLEQIRKAAYDVVNSDTVSAKQKQNAFDIIEQLNLMSSGGGIQQQLAVLRNVATIQEQVPEGLRNQLGLDGGRALDLDNYYKMINAAAQSLQNFEVLGSEQGLVGFVNVDKDIRGIRGRTDVILKHKGEGGGVRIADFKSFRDVSGGNVPDKYYAQLLEYGYLYNQMRNKIRDSGLDYKQFKESEFGKLYEEINGSVVDEKVYKTMQSDEGYLKDLALNIVDKYGRVRTLVADAQKVLTSNFSGTTLGAIFDVAFNTETPVNRDALLGSEAFQDFKNSFSLSAQENEFKDVFKGLSAEEQNKDYIQYTKELINLQKEYEETVESVKKLALNGDEETVKKSAEYIKSLEEQISLLIQKREALDKVSEAIKQEGKVLEDTADARLLIEKGEKQEAENFKSFKGSLGQYVQAYKNQMSLEARYKKAHGTQKDLIAQEMALNQEYLSDTALKKITVLRDQLSEPHKEEAARMIEDAQKMLNLQQAHIAASQKANSVWGQIGNSIKMAFYRMTIFSAGYKLVGKVAQSFKQVFEYAKQLDQSLVNVQVVTNTTREESLKLMKTYADLGRQLGATVAEVANSANVWLRQGYSIGQVNELITSSLYLAKLGMMDTATAAKDLTAIIKGFKLETSQASDVVSKLTMLDQSAAVSAGEVATAMQNLSTTAQQAGLDINTTMAYVSTVADVTQKEASTVGASLRTIMTRYGNVKAGAFSSMGVNDTGDDLENINDIEKVLRRVGISIRKSTMEFKALDDVLAELAENWSTYSSVEKNAIASAMAGTRQRESLLVLLSQYSKAEKLRDIAANSSGTAEAKYAAYEESYEASQKRLVNTWQEFSLALENTGILTSINNFLAEIVKLLPQIISTLGAQALGMKLSNSLYSVGLSEGRKGVGEWLFGGVFGGLKGEKSKWKKGLLRKGIDYASGNYEQSVLGGFSKIETLLTTIRDKIRPDDDVLSSSGAIDQNAAAQQGTGQGNGAAASNTPAIPPEDVNKKNKQGGKSTTVGGRLLRGAAIGVAQGATVGLQSGLTLKNEDGEDASSHAKWVAGGTTFGVTAVTTAALSMIPYVGPLLGPTVGPMLGQVFGTYVAPLLGNIIDQQAIARREHSKNAEKTYSSLKAIQSNTETLTSLSEKENWTYNDYQQATSVIEDITNQMYENGKAARALASYMNIEGYEGYSDAKVTALLSKKFADEYLSVSATSQSRQDLINQWNKALAEQLATQYEARLESDIYKYQEVLNTTEITGLRGRIAAGFKRAGGKIDVNGNTVTFFGDAEERLRTEQDLLAYLEDQGEETSGFYKKLQKSITDLTSAINNLSDTGENITGERLKAAAINSGILNYSSLQLKEKGLDEIVKELLDALNSENVGGIYVNSTNRNYKASWTGSYATLGETAKTYLTEYLRGDSKLLGLLTSESYTLKDVLQRKLLGDLDTTEAVNFMSKFAKSLGTTIDKLEGYIDNYGDFTLGDMLLGGSSEVFSKIDSLNEILTNLTSSTGLSAQNITEIISKFPQYIKYLGDAGSLTAAIASDIKSWINLQSQSFTDALLSSTILYDQVYAQIKDLFKEEDQEFFNWFVDSSTFGSVTDLSSFYSRYFSLTDEKKEEFIKQFSEIDKIIEQQYSSFQGSYVNKYLDIAKDYYSKLAEIQISNLQAQKSALEQINNQREYENKLVEARIKLENAQNEKRMVYREGIGFIYEADQEAISEAQEELDNLENEKLIDALDMQITELETQKKWLDEYADRNQFKQMSEAVQGLAKEGGILDELNTTGNDLRSIGQLIFQAYAQANNIDIGSLQEAVRLQGINNQTSAETELKASGQNLISAQNKLVLAQKAAQGDANSLSALKDADSTFAANYAAIDSNDTIGQQRVLRDYLTSAQDTYNTAAKSYQKAYNTASSYGINISGINFGEGITGETLSSNISSEEGWRIADINNSSIKPRIPEGLADLAAEEAAEGIMESFLKNNWMYLYSIKYAEKHGGIVKNGLVGLRTADEQSANDRIKQMYAERYPDGGVKEIQKTGYLVKSHQGSRDNFSNFINDYLQNIFPYYVEPFYGQQIATMLANNLYNTVSDAADNNAGRTLFDDGSQGGVLNAADAVNPKNIQDQLKGYITSNKEAFPRADSNALGSLYTRAGLSTISELGPELFTTPGLSGVALIPEGSKVIPADAARGLWQLGSFANQFIRPLQSMAGVYTPGDYSTSKDESVNIQNLVMNLKADKDFDIDSFTQQLRLLQAISKHNN